jgi:D-alanyl-D-alanine carboxypeptidase
VATVALQLVGEGKLSLDDTVADHLPGVVQGNGNDGRTVTVRHLLQHTSGIYNHTHDLAPVLFASYQDYLAHRYDPFQLEELVAMAMRHPPNIAPGTGWSYSNTNYLLVGMIIKKLTGNPWDQEVTDRIITPLGLKHASAGIPPEVPDPHAHAYQQFEPDEPLQDVTVFDRAGAARPVT